MIRSKHRPFSILLFTTSSPFQASSRRWFILRQAGLIKAYLLSSRGQLSRLDEPRATRLCHNESRLCLWNRLVPSRLLERSLGYIEGSYGSPLLGLSDSFFAAFLRIVGGDRVAVRVDTFDMDT